ncbi:MAG: ABC transporter substrate-binding protein, partial [Actinomycetota bacterium]
MAQRAGETGGRVTRRQLLTGAGAAAVGGLVVGGAGGYLAGNAGDDGGGTTTDGGGGGGGGETIKIGSASPTSGPYSGDGQEMTRGQELAIEDINANGGVLGRQLELFITDVEDLAPEKMVNAARRLTNEGVVAVFSGYTSTTSAEFDVYAEYGAPMFHLNTFQPNADYVADNQISNIYHSCPTEVWYGPGFIQFMQRLIDGGAWTPSSESAAVITSNDPYSISIAQAVEADLRSLGWDIVVSEEVTAPLTEWGPVLARVRQNPPGLIFHSDYIPGDLASFQQQFRSDPTP